MPRTTQKKSKKEFNIFRKYKGFTIIVIHCPKPEYKDRIKKYDSRYNIHHCYNRDLISDKTIAKWKFLWNAKKEHRKKVISCYLSHFMVWDLIIKHHLKNVLVLEDDAYIPEDKWKYLEKLKDFHSMCYIGGSMGWKLNSKDGKNDIKHFDKVRRKQIGKTLKENKINEIKTEDLWRIGHTLGIYYPGKQEIIKLKKAMEKSQEGRLKQPIDNEFIILQKAGIVKYLFYPAIAVLHIPDAKGGFNGAYFRDNQARY